MFCSQCGKEIRENEKFCGACGAPNEGYVPQDAPEPVTAEPAAPAEQPAPETVDAAPVEQPAPVETPAAENVPEVSAAVPAAETVPEASAAVPAAEPVQSAAPAYTAPAKKGLGKGAVMGVVAAALALVALAVVLIVSLGGGPKAKVGAAAAKSLKAYASAADAVGMPDLAKLYESKKVSQSVSLELRSIASLPGYYYGDMDADALKGLGVRFTSGYDLSGRKMGFSGAAYYGSTDLITGEALIDNNVVSLYVPELFDGTAYGMDTTTLGKDLDKLEAPLPDGYEKLSFNIFDLIEQLESEPPKVDKAATKALIKAIEVKKAGTGSIDVNGSSTKCAQYHVLIPKDAMKDYIDALKDAYKESGYDKKVIEALRSTGIDRDELASIEDEIKSGYSEGAEVFTQLKDAVKELGDLELDVYVNGGYVMAAVWEGRIDGSRGELGIYLGGGKNYVDDLSVELRADNGRLSLVSNGDHAAKGGTFTDSTTLRYRDNWSDETIKSELEYQPKKSSDNFSWRVKADDQTLKADGRLAMDKNSLDLQLDDVSLTDGSGDKQFSVRAGWSVGPYSAQKLSASKTELISSMSRSSLEELEEDIEKNAERWGERMYDKYEDVFRLLSRML